MSEVVPPALNYIYYGLLSWGLLSLFVAFRILAKGSVSAGIVMRIVVVLWLAVPYLLAQKGVLLDIVGTPPNLMRLMMVVAASVFGLCLSPWGREAAARLPSTFLVGVQAFRFPLEFLLWKLAAYELLPKEMTWGGYNFDIVTGLFALLLWLGLYQNKVPNWVLWTWNASGLALLLTVVILAVLSFPAPFGMFQPPNFIVAFVPWVWLPTFLVPIALAAHLLLFRKLMLPSAASADFASEDDEESSRATEADSQS